ncbi:hypothetical protein MNBD_BACTEROID03-2779 [hydrothermal vent metagenome]|uniref:SnoaL-like domain-containing protein n=1 Tax=hydrothermal vent metagenome TaxID=652676 RepID=A0A3B0TXK2_9ZZZZ
MKKLLFLSLVQCSIAIYAQSGTEVYLFDLKIKNDTVSYNLTNVSNNKGYDNQPSFYDDQTIIFSATRNQQTDIAKYDVATGSISWVTDTSVGSEYSPLKIPNKNEISSIRLDTTGLQRLYRYDISTGKSKELLKDLKVGYHVWYKKNILVSTVLVDDRMDLIVSNLKDKTNHTAQKNVGRSLYKIPNTELISYISKENENWLIKSMNPISGEIKEIVTLPKETEDMCWMADGTILAPKNNIILKFNPKTDKKWKVLHRFKEKEIYKISRMAISPTGNRMVIVSEDPPAIVVQKQVDSFNEGNLEAFISCYSEDVLVQNFPNDTSYIGKMKMEKGYQRFMANNPGAKVEVVKRIVIGNKVIDEEMVMISGKTHQQVALYEIDNGAIISMTFIHDKRVSVNPEVIVQKQLDAYNARDIEAFLDTYSNNVVVCNFPNKMQFKGIAKMRSSYSDFFKSTPDLNCIIKNRIIIGNKVIDEEYLTVNGVNFNAVAIYEVENGKIAKVTFLK